MNTATRTPDRPLVRQLFRRPSQRDQSAHPRDLRAGDPVERDRVAVVPSRSPGTWFAPGLWAALAMFGAWMFYYRASRRLGFGMLAMFVLMAFLTRWLHDTLGTSSLLYLAIGVFVVAWIGQFVGQARSKAASRASSPTSPTC